MKLVALIKTAASVTSVVRVAAFVEPSVSKTSTSNFEAVVMAEPHKQVAISRGTVAS